MKEINLWGRYPHPPVVARQRIREELRPDSDNLARVKDPEDATVEIDPEWVYQHYFLDHGNEDRWRFVPAIIPAIEEAHRFTPQPPPKGRMMYSSLLKVKDRQGERLENFATFVDPVGHERYRWVSGYPMYRGRLAKKEKAGPPKWSRPLPGQGNPTPIHDGLSDALRSGRPPGAASVYTTREQNPSSFWRDMLLLSGLTLALGLMASHLAEVHT